MVADENEDLYDEEFDFVDDEDDMEEDDTEESDESQNGEDTDDEDREHEVAEGEGDEPVDEYGRPETPLTNYVVHIYEHKKFSRTIDRPFTPEDAETFATEFNRTSKSYGRLAVTGKNDVKPKKTVE